MKRGAEQALEVMEHQPVHIKGDVNLCVYVYYYIASVVIWEEIKDEIILDHTRETRETPSTKQIVLMVNI